MQVDSLVGTYLTMVANKALGFYIQHQINHTIIGMIITKTWTVNGSEQQWQRK